MPTTVTGSYLKSLLSLTSDKAASNLIPPLKQMKLIDEENKPTDRANEWRDDNKYGAVCEDILKEIYPSELRELYPGPDIDRNKVAQWFMTTAKLGDGAAKMATSMYILLNGTGVKEETTKTTTSGNAGSQKKDSGKTLKSKPAEANKKVEAALSVDSSTKTDNPMVNSRSVSPTLHIDLQIHISPEATTEQIDSIFASMAKHLYIVKHE